jgi:hypothetical protein
MNSLNKTVVVSLTNKSGGAVAKGDVVVLSGAVANAFITTTSAALATDMVGVVVEPNGIAADATGMVALGGYVGQVNLSASASLGDTFGTHSVAKQAAPHAAIMAGDFGEVLTTGATPAAQLWGVPVQAATQPYALIQDQKPYLTMGGSSTNSGWVTRNLNTKVTDTGGCVTLGGNQMTLAAGTYRIAASAPACQVASHRIKLYNATDAANILLGTSEYAYSVTLQNRSWLHGQFTIGSGKALEIRHFTQIPIADQGLGVYGETGGGSDVEIFTEVELWKVG